MPNMRNWREGARYTNDWRKKSEYSMARKQVEKLQEEEKDTKKGGSGGGE